MKTRSKNDQASGGHVLYFVLSAAFLLFAFAFCWGFLSGKRGIFPHDVLIEIRQTAQSLKELLLLRTGSQRSAHAIAAPGITTGGVTVDKPERDASPYLFTTLFDGDAFTARVINRRGETVRDWDVPYEQADIFVAADTGIELAKKNLTIHGAAFTDNGDLYLVVESHGLIKLDRDSHLLWVWREAAHHAVTVGPDGTVWTLTRHMVEEKENWVPLAKRAYYEDEVVQLSPDGDVLARHSVLDLIVTNQYEGILYGGSDSRPELDVLDPLHCNDVNIVTADEARHYPHVEAGNIMISLRTISTVLMFDPDSGRITWSMTGPYHRQHDPEIADDGSLLVFDNRTARGQQGKGAQYLVEPQALGYSRVLGIDPQTRAIVFEHQGTPDAPFYTSIHGKLAEMPNGNILAVESEGGRVLELDRRTAEIVWEFIHLLEPGYVGRITQAFPLPEYE